MTRIGLIVPYLPQEETEHLFERCIKSIDKRFEVYVAIDYDHDGVSIMRNEGIDELIRSKVDYITFLDADDTMEPDAYDQMAAAIEASSTTEGATLKALLMLSSSIREEPMKQTSSRSFGLLCGIRHIRRSSSDPSGLFQV